MYSLWMWDIHLRIHTRNFQINIWEILQIPIKFLNFFMWRPDVQFSRKRKIAIFATKFANNLFIKSTYTYFKVSLLFSFFIYDTFPSIFFLFRHLKKIGLNFICMFEKALAFFLFVLLLYKPQATTNTTWARTVSFS